MAGGHASLTEWLETHNLQRHTKPLTDETGAYGFASVADFKELNDDETTAIAEDLGMNIAERKRFLREVINLRSGAKQPDPEEESELGRLRLELQKQKEEALEDKRKAQELEQQRQSQLEALERKRQAEQMTQRRQQELLEQQEQLLEKKRQEQEKLQKELEARKVGEQAQVQYELQMAAEAKRGQPDFEWYMVVKNLVFVKDTPHKDATTLVNVKRGDWLQVLGRKHVDDEGMLWAELAPQETLRRANRRPPTRGFALIDGTDWGLGLLLDGPFETTGENVNEKGLARTPSRATRALVVAEEEEEEAEAGMEALTREQMVGANWAEEVERLTERWGSADSWWPGELPRGLKVFTALYGFIYAKGGSDPSRGIIRRISCKPHATFLSTGATWTGPAGGDWVEQYVSGGQDPRWLLVEGPGFEVDGPLLEDGGASEDHVSVTVTYYAPRQPVCLLRTVISTHSTVEKLARRLCSVTQLSPKSAMLVPRTSHTAETFSEPRLNGSPVMSSHVLLPHQSLLSYGLRGEVEVFLAYGASFEEDYRGGALLKEF